MDALSQQPPVMMDPSEMAMQGLYQHVKAVYRSVKDATARVEGNHGSAGTSATPSTLPHHGPESHSTNPSSALTPRGRTVAPIEDIDRRRRPWGYHSPARQPSPAAAVTPRARGSAPQQQQSPKTVPRVAAPVSSRSPSRTPSAEKPLLPLAPRGASPAPAAKRLDLTPTATKLVRGGNISPLPGSRPPQQQRGSSPAARAAAVTDAMKDRMATLESKIDELSTVLEAECQQRQVVEAEVAVLRAQQAQNAELRRQVEEQRETIMTLGSQVQFALAWIQQVDRHIAQEDEQRGAVGSAHSSQASVSAHGSSPSQSRHLVDAYPHHHNHHHSGESLSTHRLPPSQPVTLVHQH